MSERLYFVIHRDGTRRTVSADQLTREEDYNTEVDITTRLLGRGDQQGAREYYRHLVETTGSVRYADQVWGAARKRRDQPCSRCGQPQVTRPGGVCDDCLGA